MQPASQLIPLQGKWRFYEDIVISNLECVQLQSNDDVIAAEEQYLTRLTARHGRPSYHDNCKLAMMGLQELDIPAESRAQMNNLFYKTETKYHNGDKRAVANCLRKLDWKTADIIFAAVEPGFLQKIIPESVAVKLDVIGRSKVGGWFVFVMKKFFRTATIYADMVKDLLFFITIVSLITISSWLDFNFFDNFSHQIIWLQFFSIFAPLVATAIKVGIQEPLMVFGFEINNTKRKNTCISLPLAIIFSPAIPALLSNIQDIEEQNTKKLFKRGINLRSKFEAAHERIVFMRNVKKNIINFKEVELILEVSIQMAIQISMILINQSSTASTRGLNSAFEKPGSVDRTTLLLILSIMWTLKTSLTTYLGVHTLRKNGFLPTMAKGTLGLRGFLVISTRILVIVLFMSPYLGLFSLLGHHEQEIIAFQIPNEDWSSFLPQVSKSSLLEVFRFTTDSITEPSVTDYTVISLQTAYMIFWAILCVQFTVVYISKTMTSTAFKMAKLSTKLWHTLKCILFHDPFADWDENLDDEVQDLEKKFELVRREMTVGSIIQWLFNMIKLLPLIVTGII